MVRAVDVEFGTGRRAANAEAVGQAWWKVMVVYRRVLKSHLRLTAYRTRFAASVKSETTCIFTFADDNDDCLLFQEQFRYLYELAAAYLVNDTEVTACYVDRL